MSDDRTPWCGDVNEFLFQFEQTEKLVIGIQGFIAAATDKALAGHSSRGQNLSKLKRWSKLVKARTLVKTQTLVKT